MWKRWILRLAWTYLDELFMRWKASQPAETKDAINSLIVSLQQYCMARHSTTHTVVCDLIAQWRE